MHLSPYLTFVSQCGIIWGAMSLNQTDYPIIPEIVMWLCIVLNAALCLGYFIPTEKEEVEDEVQA